MLPFTVIIPNYNHSLFLAKRINSVLHQTYPYFEVIILDDCSIDNSREIIEKYRKHPKVSKIVYNNKNSGSTFKQWEEGLKLAENEYIWIAESDDFADNRFLECAANVFSSNKNIGIFKCGSKWIDKDEKLLSEDYENQKSKIINGKQFIIKKLATANLIHNASAIVFNKKYIQLPLTTAITNMSYCGDWLFWIKILTTSDLYIYRKNLNFFRRHENSVSSVSEKEGLSILEGIEVYKFIRRKYFFHFINPIGYGDKFWASKVANSDVDNKIIRNFLKKAVMINPFINLLFCYYKIKLILKND